MKPTRLLPILAFLLAGCDNERESMQPDTELTPVTFVCRQSGVTRADGTYISGTTMKGSVGVFGYYQGQDSWDADQFAPDLMFNQKMTVGDDGKSLAYTPLHYWPNNDGEQLAFFAYYPYAENHEWQHGVMVDQRDICRGKAQMEFRQRENAEEQTDLMVSGWLTNQTRQKTGCLSFTFSHVLARVALDASKYSGVTRITLSHVVMQQVLDCKGESPSWVDGTQKYGQAVIDDFTKDQTLLLIPQSMEGITLMIDHSGGTATKTFSSGSFAAGNSYTLKIE